MVSTFCIFIYINAWTLFWFLKKKGKLMTRKKILCTWAHFHRNHRSSRNWLLRFSSRVSAKKRTRERRSKGQKETKGCISGVNWLESSSNETWVKVNAWKTTREIGFLATMGFIAKVHEYITCIQKFTEIVGHQLCKLIHTWKSRNISRLRQF